MSDYSPITPPPELVQQWMAEIWHEGTPVRVSASDLYIATQAARWGADQELEACCELVPGLTNYLRDVRRPKPPSLKERIAAAITAGDERTALSLLNEALPE